MSLEKQKKTNKQTNIKKKEKADVNTNIIKHESRDHFQFFSISNVWV